MNNVQDVQDEFVGITDKEGKEYICPLNALSDSETFTDEELTHCFDPTEEGFSSDEVRAIIRSAVKKIV